MPSLAHPAGATIGPYVRDLEIVAKASEPAELKGAIIHLPL